MHDTERAIAPLPPWSFVAGVTPRHAPGVIEALLAPLSDDERVHTGHTWLVHGFAFEAHEAWEGVWLHKKARGDVDGARALQMLIRLAAAHVKLAQGSLVGAHAHAQAVLVDAARDHADAAGLAAMRSLCRWLLALSAPPVTSRGACLFPRALVEALQPARD